MFLAFILHISFVDLISLFLKLPLASGESLIHFFSTDNKNFLVLKILFIPRVVDA